MSSETCVESMRINISACHDNKQLSCEHNSATKVFSYHRQEFTYFGGFYAANTNSSYRKFKKSDA